MSDGYLCTCEEHPAPEDWRKQFPGHCRQYSRDQKHGGFCAACLQGRHAPCDSFQPASLAAYICARCTYHKASHQAGAR